MNITEIKISNWDELKTLISEFNPMKNISGLNSFWCFRGQGDSKWGLSTSLERNGLYLNEKSLLDKFKRNAHLYTNIKEIDSTLEWLSLMQHHGTPTRLLDWTKSPYIATFFALNSTVVEKGYSALWAINTFPLMDKLRQKFKRNKRYFFVGEERYFFENLITDKQFVNLFLTDWNEEGNEFFPHVLPVIPYHSHKRITIQQGLFLCPTRVAVKTIPIETTFEQNLTLAFEGLNMEESVKKYLIPKKLKAEIISELNYMNINDATLFPGLDGFARFLGKEALLQHEDDKGKYMIK